MPRYTELEHTADIGVTVYGATVPELFANAGYALFDTIVDAGTIEPRVSRAITVRGDDLEALLMNWLRELLYLFAVEQDVYAVFRVRITGVRDSSRAPILEADIAGEPLDMNKHRFETEIKAITYHQLAVTPCANGWQATVVFDV